MKKQCKFCKNDMFVKDKKHVTFVNGWRTEYIPYWNCKCGHAPMRVTTPELDVYKVTQALTR